MFMTSFFLCLCYYQVGVKYINIKFKKKNEFYIIHFSSSSNPQSQSQRYVLIFLVFVSDNIVFVTVYYDLYFNSNACIT